MHIPQTEVILRHDGTELARATLPPGEYVIGRAPEAQIRANTPLISRRHAILTINYDHLLIEDLGSSNGTFVHEKAVTEATRLFPNQSVRLGDVSVEIHRQRAPTEPGVSLAPAHAAIRRFLPDDLMAKKRYAIGSVIARGGMGAILDAQQTATRRSVAMKVMLNAGAEADVLRFIEEAQVTAQLDHPNIVPIYELGVDEQDQLFYTMKLVRGITLRKVLELLAQGVAETAKKFSLPALLTVYQKVCDAMAFAHSKGVIHRDLKPENIMLGDFGSVLVMDWGLAKIVGGKNGQSNVTRSVVMSARAAEPEFGSTMAGAIMGTPQYMAPEQAEGAVETLDRRADIYALGAILFHILYFRAPVTGRNVHEVLDKVRRGELDWSSGKRTDLPESLISVCRKALALAPEERYPRVEDLQADVLAYQNGFATSAENAGAWKQVTLLVKRNKAAAIGVAAVLFVGMTLGTNAIIEARRAERAAERATAEAQRAEMALADLKRTAPALRQLAESEANLQRFVSALDKLDAAGAIDPGNLPSLWRRVWLFTGEEKFSEALEAARFAQQKDPASANASCIPLLDELARLPESQRWSGDLGEQLMLQLKSAGASGELIALSKKFKLSADGKAKLVRERLVQWLGPNASKFLQVSETGLLTLDISKSAITTLEPLRGMPIESLNIGDDAINTLEPLTGMHLSALIAHDTNVGDLSPLSGMHLKKINIYHARIKDIAFLQGMPLEDFVGGGLGLKDFSALRGAPLKRVEIPENESASLDFLSQSPVEFLNANSNQISDLAPLRGKPLRYLNIGHNPVSNLSGLRGLPVEELELSVVAGMDLSPLLELPKLAKLRLGLSSSLPKQNKVLDPLRHHSSLQSVSISGAPFRPVADFWRDYDAGNVGQPAR